MKFGRLASPVGEDQVFGFWPVGQHVLPEFLGRSAGVGRIEVAAMDLAGPDPSPGL